MGTGRCHRRLGTAGARVYIAFGSPPLSAGNTPCSDGSTHSLLRMADSAGLRRDIRFARGRRCPSHRRHTPPPTSGGNLRRIRRRRWLRRNLKCRLRTANPEQPCACFPPKIWSEDGAGSCCRATRRAAHCRTGHRAPTSNPQFIVSPALLGGKMRSAVVRIVGTRSEPTASLSTLKFRRALVPGCHTEL